MRSSRRRLPLFPVLLCAAAVLAARPTAADGEPGGDGSGADAGISAQVARLYEDAALATQRYEAGRREAEAQRAEAQRLEALLGRQRQELAVLRGDLGRIARAQYRSGGGLSDAARFVLARDPDELMRGQHVFSRTNQAVDNAIGKSRRAEARLAADEAKATGAKQALERRNAELAVLKKGIEQKLEPARRRRRAAGRLGRRPGCCAPRAPSRSRPRTTPSPR
ncbi:Peptidase OS=Streptomyces aurantiogriseus OX=66870 GN=GCM10010251_05050 PE=4 SV=1 [Streptomyces aurantiogriseus]